MINREENPEFLNSFLDYNITILNKSPNSVKEYNYDISNFLKYYNAKLENNVDEFKTIDISKMQIDDIKNITINDIHEYIAYLANVLRCKPATRARKISSIRIFFNYLHIKAKAIETNPAQYLETPKLRKAYAKIFIFR